MGCNAGKMLADHYVQISDIRPARPIGIVIGAHCE
jgi:hypothetical protein